MRRISVDVSSFPQRRPSPMVRYRKSSFSKDYSNLSELAAPPPNLRERKRAPSMLHEMSTNMMLPPKSPKDQFKLTVVFDLDETLIYARQGPIHARPYLKDLLNFCGKHCETVVWTAGVRSYAQGVIRTIDPYNIIEHCIYRHAKWFNGEAGYIKDLGLCGRPLNNIIIFENTPDCIRGFENNGVLVSDYQGQEMDCTILDIIRLLEDLVHSKLTVQEFLQQCPLLERQHVPTDIGDTVYVYCLDKNKAMESRNNRDLYSTNPPQQYSSNDINLVTGMQSNNQNIRQVRQTSPTPGNSSNLFSYSPQQNINPPRSPYTNMRSYAFPLNY